MALFTCAIKPWLWRVNFLALMALILALSLGCEKSSYYSVKSVIVRDDTEEKDNNINEKDRKKPAGAKKDKNYVVMFYNRLYANGKYYGEIASGSEILLDSDGKVYVNGKQRNEIKTKDREILGELERIRKVGPKGDLVP